MFTGIVETIGSVIEAADTNVGRRVVISAPGLGTLAHGASISVNGVCLTAVASGEDEVTVEVIPETLGRTNLDEITRTSRVNLERPMPADGRFDGHIVQGHVDGVGIIGDVVREDDGAVTMRVDAPEALGKYMVEKGSVTVDGVSLTISAITDTGFEVALIPHTLEATTLGLRGRGDRVNLEVDVVAKYVERLLGS